jgi:tripartite-type tricarboxylate transporter receptor subunit TctC
MRAWLGILLAGATFSAAGQGFPAKPIKVVVPHAAGGNSDAFGRILAGKLSERGTQAIVENRAGAGGTVGLESVARSAPDGYTIAVADNGTHAIAPTLYAKLPYNVYRDFSAITLAVRFPTVLLIHPSVPARNAQEFVALAKANPGKYTFSSAGTGNVSHLALELFRLAAGNLEMVHVPYKGGAPAVQALIAGDVHLTGISVNTALPHIKSGRARAIGISSAARSPVIPDVPTLGESGISGGEASGWLAILGPAGLAADVVAKLNQEIRLALQSPDVRERLTSIGQEVVASSPAEYVAFLPVEVQKWGEAVKKSGARVD